MLEVETLEELRKTIEAHRLVLILVYDSQSPHGRYLASLLDDFAFKVEPVIRVVKVDAALVRDVEKELGSPPRLLLYLEGKRIWEQLGFFYNYSSDIYAIRRGILYALRRYNITPQSLGISLR
ncbi:hypothetical protein [Hyperthermus butylicus]|uniref:Uncharacterized protein n=1 Tax=Hyperthermus butylicus (strain DSM 5456 / JCM 9403 / PLM1-5) TaxID=415426 RepID=A2BLA6_HYPBU|nr:hypothetical protein [Hyperthermus butylicus]ABM80767.1 hypothetical protein Hbut_0919 [Hyperthermus butylicus DSM 5456]